MPEVKTSIELLNFTNNPEQLIEDVASISYVTQRFATKKHPKMIKFASGRTVAFEEFGLEEDPEIGKPLPGFTKDDMFVAEVIPDSADRVVKFVIAIGHHRLLEMCNATFMLNNITRKGALHYERYNFLVTNFRSQKYQPQNGFNYILPNEEEANSVERRKIERHMDTLQTMYEDLRSTELDPEWSRCCYPNNIAQTMAFHTNFRQYRHIFDSLCGDDYVGENQRIAMGMLKELKRVAPVFFHDFVISDDGKSAKRRGSKYARNKFVNWMLTRQEKIDFGLDVPPQPKGQETEID